MSDFEDDFLKDFQDDAGDESSDESASEDEKNEGNDEKDDDAIDVELAIGSDVPKTPVRNDAEFQRLLESLQNPDTAFKGTRTEEIIETCNKAVSRITSEISIWHRRACRLYHPAFPELEKLVPDPVDFAKVILTYGHNDEADLSEVLPAATVMVIKVSKSVHVNSIKTFSQSADLNAALEAAREIIELNVARSKLVSFLEAKIRLYAPNLSDLVGPKTAALLVGIAGGLDQLLRIPANDIQVLGRSRAARADTGVVHGTNAAFHRHGGVLAQCPLILSTPVHLRRKALRMLAGRVALAARVDESGRDKSSGRIWREEIEQKLNKLQEPGPGKAKKALPIPDAKRPKRRGGRRARSLREKMGMTTMRALANREKFGEGNEDVEYSVAAMGQDLGMLTKAANGRVRTTQVKDTQKLGLHAAKKLRGINAGGNNNVSGFSSLAFTPIQGMELAPSVHPGATSDANKKTSRPPVPMFSSNKTT